MSSSSTSCIYINIYFNLFFTCFYKMPQFDTHWQIYGRLIWKVQMWFLWYSVCQLRENNKNAVWHSQRRAPTFATNGNFAKKSCLVGTWSSEKSMSFNCEITFKYQLNITYWQCILWNVHGNSFMIFAQPMFSMRVL